MSKDLDEFDRLLAAYTEAAYKYGAAEESKKIKRLADASQDRGLTHNELRTFVADRLKRLEEAERY
ncbi:hypothetical protein [Aureimonas sp. AU40]|uniref:hypothetical protein n=1 Tax=Aureimonas sp. AU40 TaxID=1637747 RepID=UPI000780FE1A|nr:hypothetical protein [Aureimonas sp. AU40]